MKLTYSFLSKFLTLLIAGAALSAVIMMVTLNLLRPAERMLYLVTILPLVMLPFGFVFFWQRREKQQPAESPKIMAFWQGFISYFLAFDIVSFGWKKVFGLQFRPVPLSIADMPMAEQSPDWLMWHFFGYSHTFGMLVAAAQIMGSWLLLFRQTRLVGVLVLLPIMLNILLINNFYHLGIGPLYQSIVLVAGLIYLLSTYYNQLVEFFFRPKNSLPTITLGGRQGKNVIRLLVMVLAFSYIYIFYLRSKSYSESELHGIYDVKSMILNQQPVTLASTVQDSVLNRVYFDDGNACILQFNNYNRRLFGHYDYDPARQTLKSIFDFKSTTPGQYMPRGTADTLQATLTRLPIKNTIAITGLMGKDSVQLVLLKVR